MNLNTVTTPRNKEEEKPELQFIRLNFTSLWFDGFEFILKSIKKRKTITNHKNRDADILNYSLLPTHLYKNTDENIIEIIDSMEFNKKNLQLTKNDIKIIKFTLQTENIKYFLKQIQNANQHNDVIINLNNIKICFILSSFYRQNYIKEKLSIKNILDNLYKFLIT